MENDLQTAILVTRSQFDGEIACEIIIGGWDIFSQTILSVDKIAQKTERNLALRKIRTDYDGRLNVWEFRSLCAPHRANVFNLAKWNHAKMCSENTHVQWEKNRFEDWYWMVTQDKARFLREFYEKKKSTMYSDKKKTHKYT